jgi:hypothetical protein
MPAPPTGYRPPSSPDLEAARDAARAHAKAEAAQADALEAQRTAREHDRRIGALEGKFDDLLDDVRGMSTKLGRPPHHNGPEDEGEGIYKIACEIARAQRGTRRSHALAGGGIGAALVAVVLQVLQLLNASRADASGARVGFPPAVPPAAVK